MQPNYILLTDTPPPTFVTESLSLSKCNRSELSHSACYRWRAAVGEGSHELLQSIWKAALSAGWLHHAVTSEGDLRRRRCAIISTQSLNSDHCFHATERRSGCMSLSPQPEPWRPSSLAQRGGECSTGLSSSAHPDFCAYLHTFLCKQIDYLLWLVNDSLVNFRCIQTSLHCLLIVLSLSLSSKHCVVLPPLIYL